MQVIDLYVDAVSSCAYKLQLSQLANLSSSYQVVLRDNYLKDSLIMQQGTAYSFNINKEDSTTFAGNRFQLVINSVPLKIPEILALDADKTSRGSRISWTAKGEQNTTAFYVERSIDKGQSFQPVGSLQSNNSGKYDLIDKTPARGENQYRVKIIDHNNNAAYSNIAALYYETAPDYSVNIRIYPNPTTSAINLSIKQGDNKLGNFKINSYSIKIVNSFG